ncbi:hypothetical protein [Lederbergia citrea]|uniref:Uncharacterized protein n=1 Tax=Lederbergia citrea TaxID=2833581 RepID=A0A942UIH5_9BACI|nr:hypothetical protein [Lederbergia citrea]MBS4204160.1 hypothetical protein [Lederbergia citrea]MBS4221255.1 hypothetical protein [Lederbergia citrea]
MWKWIFILIIPIIVFAIIEEMIYFIINRTFFRSTKERRKIKEKLTLLKNKIMMKDTSV